MSLTIESPTPPPPPPPAWQPPQAKPPRRRRSLATGFGIAFRLVAAAAAIAISLSMDGGIFGGLVALFIIVVPFEKMYPRKKGQKVRRPMVATDLAFALMNPVLNIATAAAVIVIGVFSFFWVPGLLLRPVVNSLPAVALPFVAFVLFDFLGYWTHRWAHEVPFLWRFHAVHHSPEHMDWVSGFRVHPFDGVLIAPSAFFLIAAGFDPEVTGVLVVLQIVLGIFFHANVRVRWRWLDKLLANPEFHHWHHANEADSICHNYAAALPQWDLLFGTYFMPNRRSERRPQHYGLDEYTPRTMLGLLTHPLRGARGHVHLLWHPVRAIKAIFAGTKNLLRAVRRSTLRRTHSVRVETLPGCSTTNRSLFQATPPGVAPAVTDVPAGVVIEF